MTFLPPTRVRTLPNPAKFGSGVLFDKPRIDILREKIASDTLRPRVKTKWDQILALPDTPVIQGVIDPWEIPENYSDQSEVNQLLLSRVHADTMAAVGYAFRYMVNGAESDAVRAVAYIEAYSSIQTFATNSGSTLNWFDKWPLLIQAAMMVRGSAAYTPQVDTAFRATLTEAITTLEPIAYTRDNNWAAWGLTMEFAYALIANNRTRFDLAVQRWRDLFNDTVVSGYKVNNGGPAQGQTKNNVARREIYRMGSGYGNGAYGLLYSAFHLDGLVIAAEWARAGGEWLYDHTTADGSTLRGFWENIAHEKRFGAPALGGHPAYLSVQWYNTSNLSDPSSDYYFSGYYTNRVGGSFYILQELWPLQDAAELMHGGFTTVGFPAGVYPPVPDGDTPKLSTGYPILQDYYGMYGADLLYSDRPLYG